MLETYLGEISATTAAIVWALALVLFARAGRTVPPRALNVFKNGTMVPLFFVTLLLLGRDLVPDLDPGAWMVLAVSSVLGIAIADTMLFASLNRIGAGWTAVLTCTHSPFVIGIIAIAFGVPVTLPVAIGSLVVGAAVVLAAGRIRFHALEGRTLAVGLALGLLAQLGIALGISIMKYPVLGHPALMESVDVMTLTVWRMIIGTGVLAFWMFIRRDPALALRHFRPSVAWRWMLPGAFLGSYVGMFLWMLGIQAITGALTRAAILNQLTAIALPVFGRVLLAEPLSRRKVMAIVLAVVGACIVVVGR